MRSRQLTSTSSGALAAKEIAFGGEGHECCRTRRWPVGASLRAAVRCAYADWVRGTQPQLCQCGRVVGAGIACCAEGAGSATISLDDGYARVSSMTVLSLSALSGMRHGELFRVGTFYVGFNPSCDQRGSGIPSVSNAASCSLAPVRPSTCSRVARRAHGNRKRQWMK